jgi:hypothetical protein
MKEPQSASRRHRMRAGPLDELYDRGVIAERA